MVAGSHPGHYRANFWVEYWLNNVERMELLIAQSTTLIRERGTSYQRARFVQLMAMRNIRRERYLLGDDTVQLAREAWEAGAESQRRRESGLTIHPFLHALLVRALRRSRPGGSIGSLPGQSAPGAVTLRVRTLTYLTAVARRQGRIERVRDWVRQMNAVYETSPSSQKPSGPDVNYYRGALLGERVLARLARSRTT